MADVTERFDGWIDLLREQDEEGFRDYFAPTLEHISGWVDRGVISEAGEPASFARLREVLRSQKGWVTAKEERIKQLQFWRRIYPRSHWWWWIEEL